MAQSKFKVMVYESEEMHDGNFLEVADPPLRYLIFRYTSIAEDVFSFFRVHDYLE